MPFHLIKPVAIAGMLSVILALPVAAKDIVVQVKNNGAQGIMVFEPSFVRADPGDTIVFKPTDPGHNAETIPGMLPAGAVPLRGGISQEVSMPVTKRGLYGVRCSPHFAMGMVALIEVGAPQKADVAAAMLVKLPPLAAKRMAPMLDKVSQQLKRALLESAATNGSGRRRCR